jgi:hypothetical protein
LLKTFLRLDVVGDDKNGLRRENVPQQCGKKGLGRRVNAGTRQCTTLLQSPRQGLHSGSLRNPVEQVACRRDSEILRQALAKSQPE